MPSEKDRAKKNLVQRLALKSCLAKETLSEFLGTFIMIVSIARFPFSQFRPNPAFLAARRLEQGVCFFVFPDYQFQSLLGGSKSLSRLLDYLVTIKSFVRS
jgi:hypothetical protein